MVTYNNNINIFNEILKVKFKKDIVLFLFYEYKNQPLNQVTQTIILL